MLARLRRSNPIGCVKRDRQTRSGRKVAERRQRVAAGVNPQFHAPDVSQVAKQRQVGTTWFDKWFYQAIYWYLVEQIAERLKSGELRNPKIYEFNPDAVYDPKRHRKKSCDQTRRTKNQARRTNHQEELQTGIPPPREKTSRKIT